MQVVESIIMAWQSLIANKLRSILTLLGISIGLFAIIIVMTSIRAIQSSVEDIFNSIGTNNFIIQKYPAVRVGHGLAGKYRNRKDLTIEQGDKLKKIAWLPSAVGISRSRGGKIAKYGNIKTNPEVELWGTNLDDLKANDVEIISGRAFTEFDMQSGREFCLIGSDIQKKLFENLDPIGEVVKVDGYNYKIIGVCKERGSVMGIGQDSFVAIPLRLFTKNYGSDGSFSFVVQASSKDNILQTMDEVISALRVIRKVGLMEENDFEIVTNDQLIEQFNDLTKYFKIASGIIAFIALVAAGVGIMNIMLVSVTERTREIGIRKAVGAKKIVIRLQFILEAIVLSQIGGIIGIIMGLIGGNLIASVLNVNTAIPLDWILIGIFITTCVGVIFGSYPAIKASNLDPIEALRFE